MPLTAVHSESWPPSPGGTALLLLHGYGSNERDLPGIAAMVSDLPWASVRAPLEMGYGGAAWFPLTPDGDWLAPGPIEDATAALWEWIEAELDQSVPLVPVGFSQGGLMATQLLRTRPERVAATVVLSGFVLDVPQPGDGEVAGAPVFFGRGTADAVVPPAYFSTAAAWLGAHTDLTERVYDGLPHSVSDRELAELRGFLASCVA